VEISLGVGFCGQSGLSSRPYYPTTGFWPPLSVLVFAEPLSDRPGSVPCKFVQMGSVYIWRMQMWSTPDEDPHCRLVSRIQSGWWSTEDPFCRWLCNFLAEFGSERSTRKMKNWVKFPKMKLLNVLKDDTFNPTCGTCMTLHAMQIYN